MTSEAQQGEATEKEIEDLRERLKQAELSEAVETASVAGVLNVVQEGDKSLASRLGHTIFTPVAVNGVTTYALVDTGSPATIVSLSFALDVLRKSRTVDQMDQQLAEDTLNKFMDPDVTLRSYRGVKLDFIAQTELSLTRGNREVTVMISSLGQMSNLVWVSPCVPEMLTGESRICLLVRCYRMPEYLKNQNKDQPAKSAPCLLGLLQEELLQLLP